MTTPIFRIIPILCILLHLFPCISVRAESIDSLHSSISAYHCGLWQVAEPLYSGPVSTGLRPGGSWTQIAAQGGLKDATPTWQNFIIGRTRWLSAGASTRTRTPRGIITASAEYRNSHLSLLSGCETLEAPLLYPYLTSDSIGGALKGETYRMEASISDSIGPVSVGIGGAYRATLEYRQVDPRPRNVTGDLCINLGALYAISRAQGVTLDLRAARYRHASEISFVNPLGGTVIYHTTGPQSQYRRFAGLGLSSLYTGHSLGAALSMLPLSIVGVSAGVSMDYNAISKQLVDLNRLPLCHLSRWQYSAILSYTSRLGAWHLMPYAQWHHTRIYGYENIFGDATSGVYPKIASIEMYGCRYSHAFVGMAAKWGPTLRHTIMIDGQLGTFSLHEAYRTPAYDSSHRYLEWHTSLRGANTFGNTLLTSRLGVGSQCGEEYACAQATMYHPLSSTLLGALSAEYRIQHSGHLLFASLAIDF